MRSETIAKIASIKERLGQAGNRQAAFSILREQLSLPEFGELMFSMPNPSLPELSGLLPAMVSSEIQMNWTGNQGDALLAQSLAFVESLADHYTRITGRAFKDLAILDYGCGYGRLARLMYYFSDERQIYGLDSWQTSITLCHQHGMTENIRLSEFFPERLPVPDAGLDVIYAFSVFTHLSRPALLKCLMTLRSCLRPDGLLAITIRPADYWHISPQACATGNTELMLSAHERDGFAYMPITTPISSQDYGEASMTLAWLAAHAPGLKIVASDHSPLDSHQHYVFLQRSDAGS